MATILLVESERLVRDVAGRWLEDAGHEVLACPGPSGPDSTCLGASGKPCPLERGADLERVRARDLRVQEQAVRGQISRAEHELLAVGATSHTANTRGADRKQ